MPESSRRRIVAIQPVSVSPSHCHSGCNTRERGHLFASTVAVVHQTMLWAISTKAGNFVEGGHYFLKILAPVVAELSDGVGLACGTGKPLRTPIKPGTICRHTTLLTFPTSTRTKRWLQWLGSTHDVGRGRDQINRSGFRAFSDSPIIRQESSP